MEKSIKIDDLLVCPRCKNDLVRDHQGDGYHCFVCNLKYPIKNGIPDMLEDEAEEI